jgi:hypothetical protein
MKPIVDVPEMSQPELEKMQTAIKSMTWVSEKPKVKPKISPELYRLLMDPSAPGVEIKRAGPRNRG